jgi:phosphohistidine phosphatase SixA
MSSQRCESKLRGPGGLVGRIALATVAMVVFSAHASAQGTVFLVRHAERADTVTGGPAMMGTDPSLSDAGHARAAALTTVLKDAGLTAIFVTEYKRTQETAAPIAKALALTPLIVSSKDTQALLAKLKDVTGNVLVVGHSNSVPEIIKGLGVGGAPSIADDQYDQLFIVTRDGPPRLIQLHYR